jgi:hypothetical protein
MNSQFVTLRSYSGKVETTHDPEEGEVAEAIINFPRRRTHHRNDLSLHFGQPGGPFSSKLDLCLSIEGAAMLSYSDSRDDQVFSLLGDATSDGFFAIDDGGGEDIEIPRKFLVARSRAVEVALGFLADPRFDPQEEPGDWTESPFLW